MLLAVALTVGLTAVALPSPAQGDEVIDKVRQSQEIADQLDALNLKLYELSGQQEVARHQLDDATKAAAEAQARLDAANADLSAHQKALASFSVEAYISGGGSTRMDSLLSSPSQSAEVAAGYIDTVGEKRQQLIDELAATRNRIDSEAEHLALAQRDAQSLSDQVDQAGRDTDAALAEQKQLQDKVTGELVDLVTTDQQRLAQQAAEAGQSQSVANDAGVTGPAPPQHASCRRRGQVRLVEAGRALHLGGGRARHVRLLGARAVGVELRRSASSTTTRGSSTRRPPTSRWPTCSPVTWCSSGARARPATPATSGSTSATGSWSTPPTRGAT